MSERPVIKHEHERLPDDYTGPHAYVIDSNGRRWRLPPELETELRAADEDIRAGRVVTLTPEELEQWEATGELPEAVEARFAALECTESRD